MEGTRNEKVLIIICSYVIGFTTAYIAYGIVQSTESGVLADTAGTFAASAISAPALPTAEPISYEVADDGLYLIKDSEELLISANAGSLSEEEVADFEGQGVHSEVANVTLTDDGKYLYFCETFPGQDTCTPFVYSVDEEVVRPQNAQPSVDAVVAE